MINNAGQNLITVKHKFHHQICLDCNTKASWSKLVYNSFRNMNPMMVSEKIWNTKVDLTKDSSVVYKLEKFSNASIINLGTDLYKLECMEKMSPYNFDSYKTVFTAKFEPSSCKIGVILINEELNQFVKVLMNFKTRKIHLFELNQNSNNTNKLIPTQRFKNQAKLIKSKLNSVNSKSEQNDFRQNLMNEIRSLKPTNDLSIISSLKTLSDSWRLTAGDSITVKLIAKENGCDLLFYFNEEIMGQYTIDELSSVSIYPHVEIEKGDQSKFFFDTSKSLFTSTFGNEFSFKAGMFVELEKELNIEEQNLLKSVSNEDEVKTFITMCLIEKVDDLGKLLIKIYGTEESFWLEPTSDLIHPCGFWKYINKEFRSKSKDSIYENIVSFKVFDKPSLKYLSEQYFDWDLFFKEKQTALPAPFDVFNENQLHEMSKKYHVDSVMKDNILSCDFTYNPRFIWSNLKKLTDSDISHIYNEIGLIKQIDDDLDKTSSRAIVLIPDSINKSFLKYPNVNSLISMSNLNISCIHREDIKIFSGNTMCISKNFSHLMQGKSLNLVENKLKLDLGSIIILTCTCLDLSNSSSEFLFPNFQISDDKNEGNFDKKQLNESLKHYFKQVSSLLCLVLPFFNEPKYRTDKSLTTSDLIIAGKFESNAKLNTGSSRSDTLNKNETNKLKIELFLNEKITEFGINSSGLCKYCSVFMIDLVKFNLKQGSSLDSFIKKAIKSLADFSNIITSIDIKDDIDLITNEEPKCLSLSKKLFKNLPNLANIIINNVKIIEIDSFINQCKNLKNIQLTNNYLTEIPFDLFNKNTSITQIIIDNQPLKEIPASIFTIKTLQSIVLSRLNILKFPDGWLCEQEETNNIKSVCITQCPLKSLPKDLVTENNFLEELTFQGVNLILPENENEWSLMSVDLNKVIQMYCPNLLSIEEATKIFKKFDYDNNNILDYRELQHFNAFIIKHFPRAAETNQNINTDLKLPDSEVLSWKVLFNCRSITYLDFSFQAIKRITNAIKNLKNLKILKLKYCVYLESLSSNLGLLKLDELDLTGCISLKTPPIEIQRRGVNSVLAYLNRLLTGSVECKRTKLMLQGLGGVGKTSLIEAMINKTYQNSTKTPPILTDGISISDWRIDIKNIEPDSNSKKSTTKELVFSVFDFAGQQVYYHTHQFFLTNRSVYVLVWNVRLGSQHSGLEFWLSSIECHAPTCPIYIVGTHIDEVNKYDLPIEKLKKKYPQIVGFHYVSSYDGRGVDNLTNSIIETALKEKYMGEKIPKCWLDFENKLHEMKKEKEILELVEVEKIAADYGIFDQNELTQALVFLHDLGSIMYFNNQFLKDKVVINPQFMVDLLACLVSVNNNFIIDGKLSISDVTKIWKKYNSNLHDWILKVTEKFDLTFEIPEQKIHLVPCLMSETEPNLSNLIEINGDRILLLIKDSKNFDITFKKIVQKFITTYNGISEITKVSTNTLKSDNLDLYTRHTTQFSTNTKETKIIYNFEYLPIGLFNRAQVRLFLLTDNKAIWKNGSLLVKNHHIALMTRIDNTIEVRCIGINPENLLFLIHEVFEVLIAESFNGVNYDFSFPCPDCFEQNSINSEKSMFSASLVRQATKMKAVFLQCRNYFHVVPIADLHSKMPPDSLDSYDLQLRNSVRDLKHLKQKLSYDIVIIYSSKDTENTNLLHPRQIKQDLEKNGFSCWFSETIDTIPIESITVLIRNSTLALFCITDNFTSDKRCCDLFNYAKLSISKQYILVMLGDSFQWQQTQLGALITHEFFIKINTIARYQTSLPDLLELTKKKLESVKNKIKLSKYQNDSPLCFISYCRVNSHDAVSKGTPLKTKESLGWGDPRTLKTNLEKAGYNVWIDYEQIGTKNTLFEDIVEGIRNAKVFIACISNEYAISENCMKEFRFASNLKKPIIICTFGSAYRKSEWKNTELGIISCLNNKEINFQIENEKAYSELINEIKSYKIEPIKVDNKNKNENEINQSESQNSDLNKSSETNQAYTELIELTQRKFLRQIASFSENASSRPFPRLFIVDLQEESFLSTNSSNLYSLNLNSIPNNSSQMNSSNLTPSSFKKRSDRYFKIPSSVTEKLTRYSLRSICEHESGWHPSGLAIDYELSKSIPQSHYAYLIRLMSLIKHSELNLDILKNPEKLDELINYMEENLNTSQQSMPISTQSPSKYTSLNSDFNISNFKESYFVIKNYIINKLDFMYSNFVKAETNSNRVEHFSLNRCMLPSGKILWLCDDHSREEHVQILTRVENLNFSQFQNDEFNLILMEELKKHDSKNNI